MLRPVLVTPPVVKPVSLEEAKAHCRVDVADDDTVIVALIDAAISHLDGWAGVLGRCMVNQVWRINLGDWPRCGIIRLPFPDVSAATIKYFDADNSEQTVSSSLFERLEDERGVFISLGAAFTFPTVFDDRSDGVKVEFTAGYGAAATAVPASLRTAILLTVAHWYENRETAAAGSVTEIPFGASAMIAPFRRVGI